MNRTALAVLSGLLALTAPVACSSQAKSAPSPAGKADVATAKVSAPVAVDAKLDGGRAHVTLRFDASASDVQVNVSGLDGLTVRSAGTPVAGNSFTKSGETSFDVEFTPGPGRSHLVVAVTGSFEGSHMSKVASFAVGTPTAEQKQSSGTTVTGSDGERIKVMPASGGQQ
ncbi:hypothetical protein ACLESD_02995 [Pyxidicoccus sp. 3LFB2]